YMYNILIYADVILIEPHATLIYTLSLHDALPIFLVQVLPAEHSPGEKEQGGTKGRPCNHQSAFHFVTHGFTLLYLSRRFRLLSGDRKSTRLNSSHVSISNTVFFFNKKINIK